jgi:hypothetical protein
VTHNSTRKRFFAKLLGAGVASVTLPKLLAKPAFSTTALPAPGESKSVAAFEIRHDARAVSRRDVI